MRSKQTSPIKSNQKLPKRSISKSSHRSAKSGKSLQKAFNTYTLNACPHIYHAKKPEIKKFKCREHSKPKRVEHESECAACYYWQQKIKVYRRKIKKHKESKPIKGSSLTSARMSQGIPMIVTKAAVVNRKKELKA
jgi:hypothetical protein